MINFLDGHCLPAGIYTGAGCRHRLSEVLDRLNLRRVLVVCGASLLNSGYIDDLITNAAGKRATPASGATEAAIAAAGLHAAEIGADGIISVGGGTAHDIAKGAALVAPSGRPISDFLLGAPPPHGAPPPLPVVAIPSTFSAAEMSSGGAVLRDKGGKSLFWHAQLRPSQVLLDGELVGTTPNALLAVSGLNAVHHCLEALASKGHQPMSDAWALFAFERLMRLLPDLAPVAPPCSVDVYQDLLEASAFSGLAYDISGLGVGHAICHSLAGRWGASHGNANAVVLPHSVAFNLARAPARLAVPARVISGADLLSSLATLCDRLEAPRSLRQLGLPAGQFDLIADDVLADPVTATNPGDVTRADVQSILEACW